MRKLEIGSGTRPRAGYEHSDLDPKVPCMDFYCSMECVPVADCSYDEVLSVHVIEHVPFATAQLALAEWHRILKDGGFADIDTPNIERNLSYYLNGLWKEEYATLPREEQLALCRLGEPDPALWLNWKIFSAGSEYNLHYWNATPKLLEQMCYIAGFRAVEFLATDPSLHVRAYK